MDKGGIYVDGVVPMLPDSSVVGTDYVVGPDCGLASGGSLSGLKLAHSSAVDNAKPIEPPLPFLVPGQCGGGRRR